MNTNVSIRHYQHGALAETRTAHNVVVQHGREWLANLVALGAAGVPLSNYRIRGMMVGIGGKNRGTSGAGVNAVYQPGYDPFATAGNTYDKDYPISPLVGTLEMPVRFTGGTTGYGTVVNTDVWVSPAFYTGHRSPRTLTCVATIDCTAGSVIYSSLDSMAISEAGLVTDEVDSQHNPYLMPVVAYVNFPSFTVDNTSYVEVEWELNFL